ncbi:MAG: hypothetical protein EZS28_039152, partial [Streblomastix strix]
FAQCDIIATKLAAPWNVKHAAHLTATNRIPGQPGRTGSLTPDNMVELLTWLRERIISKRYPHVYKPENTWNLVETPVMINSDVLGVVSLPGQLIVQAVRGIPVEYTTLPMKYWRGYNNDGGYQNKETLSSYLIDVVFPGIVEVRNDSQGKKKQG